MKSTGKWVYVIDHSGNGVGVRMLHEDRRGRLCVRYQKQWRLVTEKRVQLGRTYQIEGLA